MYLDLEFVYFKIYTIFTNVYNFFADGSYSETIYRLELVAAVLSSVFFVGIVFNLISLSKLNKKRLAEFVKTILEVPPPERATRWEKIKKHLQSENGSDWRVAILEADSLVDDIIKKIGYAGETFGERLLKIKPAQLKSLNELWVAHKVRNRIAHEPGYKLNRGEAENAIDLYEKVLKELEYL